MLVASEKDNRRACSWKREDNKQCVNSLYLFIYIGYAKFTAHAILANFSQPDPEELGEAFHE